MTHRFAAACLALLCVLGLPRQAGADGNSPASSSADQPLAANDLIVLDERTQDPPADRGRPLPSHLAATRDSRFIQNLLAEPLSPDAKTLPEILSVLNHFDIKEERALLGFYAQRRFWQRRLQEPVLHLPTAAAAIAYERNPQHAAELQQLFERQFRRFFTVHLARTETQQTKRMLEHRLRSEYDYLGGPLWLHRWSKRLYIAIVVKNRSPYRLDDLDARLALDASPDRPFHCKWQWGEGIDPGESATVFCRDPAPENDYYTLEEVQHILRAQTTPLHLSPDGREDVKGPWKQYDYGGRVGEAAERRARQRIFDSSCRERGSCEFMLQALLFTLGVPLFFLALAVGGILIMGGVKRGLFDPVTGHRKLWVRGYMLFAVVVHGFTIAGALSVGSLVVVLSAAAFAPPLLIPALFVSLAHARRRQGVFDTVTDSVAMIAPLIEIALLLVLQSGWGGWGG